MDIAEIHLWHWVIEQRFGHLLMMRDDGVF